MSAVARDYAYVVEARENTPQEPVITNEQLEAFRAAMDKYPRDD